MTAEDRDFRSRLLKELGGIREALEKIAGGGMLIHSAECACKHNACKEGKNERR